MRSFSVFLFLFLKSTFVLAEGTGGLGVQDSFAGGRIPRIPSASGSRCEGAYRFIWMARGNGYRVGEHRNYNQNYAEAADVRRIGEFGRYAIRTQPFPSETQARTNFQQLYSQLSSHVRSRCERNGGRFAIDSPNIAVTRPYENGSTQVRMEANHAQYGLFVCCLERQPATTDSQSDSSF